MVFDSSPPTLPSFTITLLHCRAYLSGRRYVYIENATANIDTSVKLACITNCVATEMQRNHHEDAKTIMKN